MPRVVTLETIQGLFSLPLTLAAAELEMSVSGFSKLMRSHGVERWPCRTEHVNKRNARLVQALRAALQAKNRTLAHEALLAFQCMAAGKVAVLLGMKAARFRKFHQGFGVAMWPYRPKRRQPYTLKNPDDTQTAIGGHEGSSGAKEEAPRTFIDSSESSGDAKEEAPRTFIDSSESSDDAKEEAPRTLIDSSESSDDAKKETLNACVGGSKMDTPRALVGGSKRVDDVKADMPNARVGDSMRVHDAKHNAPRSPVGGSKKRHNAKSTQSGDDADSNAMLVYDDSGLPLLDDAALTADLIPPGFFCGDEQARMQDMMEYYESFGCLPDLHSEL